MRVACSGSARSSSTSTTRPNAPNDLLPPTHNPTVESPALLLAGTETETQTQMAASSSSSSSSSAAGYALAATAMALSGTLVLFSLRRAKPSPAESPRLRPCLSSSEKRRREKPRRGSVKRVRFADDSVDDAPARAAPRTPQAMPANREALYRGMLRGRSMLRVACSY